MTTPQHLREKKGIMTVLQRLREKGYSREQVGALIGKSAEEIAFYEENESNIPDDIVDSFCARLDVEVEDLFPEMTRKIVTDLESRGWLPTPEQKERLVAKGILEQDHPCKNPDTP